MRLTGAIYLCYFTTYFKINILFLRKVSVHMRKCHVLKRPPIKFRDFIVPNFKIVMNIVENMYFVNKLKLLKITLKKFQYISKKCIFQLSVFSVNNGRSCQDFTANVMIYEIYIPYDN